MGEKEAGFSLVKGEQWSMAWCHGVAVVTSDFGRKVPTPPDYEEYAQNLKWLNNFVFNKGPSRSLAKRRLKILEMHYNTHVMMNESYEVEESKHLASDFNAVPKVDNHIHAAGSMTAAEFLDFLKTKVVTDGSKVVMRKDGEETLKQLLMKHCRRDESCASRPPARPRNPSAFNADSLDMQATVKLFQRFDNFNDSYNPFGDKNLREVFL